MTEFKHSGNLNIKGETNGGSACTSPVDTFEQSFQACLTAITKEDTLSNLDRDEIKVDADLTLQSFIDSARAMEGYFLKKRLQIAAQKSELLVKDDTSELRLEIMRKDELLKKNFEKMSHWQSILADLQSSIGGKPGQASVAPITSGTSTSSTSSGPLTPIGRPQTPASVGPGRPQTPITSAPNTRMIQSPNPNVGYHSPMSQSQQQQQQPSGLQGPLAYLEKTASTIGMNENR